MLSMLLIESSPPLVRRPLVVVVGSGKRDGEVPGNGAVGSFGFRGSFLRSDSLFRRSISSGRGFPIGPVVGRVPDVGIDSSLGNVCGVVPPGVLRITSIVGN